jgi:hypothetical protein
MNRSIRFGFSLTVLFFTSAIYAEDAAIVVMNKIEGLNWLAHHVSTSAAGSKVVTFAGRFNHPGWSLVGENQAVILAANGNFSVKTSLQPGSTHFEIMATGPQGEIESETVGFFFDKTVEAPPTLAANETRAPASETIQAETSVGADRPPLMLTPSLAFTNVAFSQSNSSAFSETATTLGVDYHRSIFISDLKVGGNASFTLFPFSTNQATLAARYFEMSADAGYHLPWIAEPWSLSLMVGAFYSTMIVTNNAFGYNNLLAPELFPTLKRKITARDALSIFVKFVPLGSGLFNFGFSEREIVAGLIYERELSNGHPVSIGIDYADLRFSPVSYASVVSQIFDIKLGYTF